MTHADRQTEDESRHVLQLSLKHLDGVRLPLVLQSVTQTREQEDTVICCASRSDVNLSGLTH